MEPSLLMAEALETESRDRLREMDGGCQRLGGVQGGVPGCCGGQQAPQPGCPSRQLSGGRGQPQMETQAANGHGHGACLSWNSGGCKWHLGKCLLGFLGTTMKLGGGGEQMGWGGTWPLASPPFPGVNPSLALRHSHLPYPQSWGLAVGSNPRSCSVPPLPPLRCPSPCLSFPRSVKQQRWLCFGFPGQEDVSLRVPGAECWRGPCPGSSIETADPHPQPETREGGGSGTGRLGLCHPPGPVTALDCSHISPAPWRADLQPCLFKPRARLWP